MTTKAKEVKKITYKMQLVGGGVRTVTIPADWKVTFGPAIPSNASSRRGGDPFCFRVYEALNKQRCVWTDVTSFECDLAPSTYDASKIFANISKNRLKGMSPSDSLSAWDDDGLEDMGF